MTDKNQLIIVLNVSLLTILNTLVAVFIVREHCLLLQDLAPADGLRVEVEGLGE